MPRRKVPLADRLRATQACRLCKASKKRCNASLPCDNCVRRGTADSCTFDANNSNQGDSPASPQVRRGPDSSAEKVRQNHAGVVEAAGSASDDVQSEPSALNGPASSLQFDQPEVQSPGETHRTRPRMLSNARGEKVYIGGSASLSFLQLVRDTVSQCIGASEFSHNETRDRMLEADLRQDSDTETVQLDLQQQETYIESFLVETSGLFNVLSKEEILGMLYGSPGASDGTKSLCFAVPRLAMAIGAQSTSSDLRDPRHERYLFSQAQNHAISEMLEDPCLEMVRCFILMSFYMLGACRRNATFMYLGVAARAAYALGLHHSESYRSFDETAKASRSKIWKSLVTLDYVVCSILGRTSATSFQRAVGDVQDPLADDLSDGNQLAFRATSQLSTIIDDIVNKLYGSKIATVESAELQLQRLREWSQNLPESLRVPQVPLYRDAKALEGVVGSLHVSCFYYFAVMLVTRPFLIAHLTKRLAAAQRTPPAAGSSIQLSDDHQTAKIAHSCLTSAMYMAQTCSEVQQAGFLLENMRILKAWIFAAGLVLGFQMFAISDTNLEVEDAFRAARAVLQKLSARSPQAAHYFDILTYLWSAITKMRQMHSSQPKEPSDIAVDRIMRLGVGVGAAQEESTPSSASIATTGTSGTLPSTAQDIATPATPDTAMQKFSADDRWMQNLQLEAQGFQPEVLDSLLGWESAALQFWDQFPVGATPFEMHETGEYV